MAEWFEEWFNDEYLELYPHRDHAEADRLVALLRQVTPWREGWRVLDVACGPGRHARALEAAGARCIGLDLSAVLLRRARQATRSPLVRADMRHIPVRRGSMDLTVNLFTSFGYFADDTESRTALREMAATVRSGGWFALDFLNAPRVRASLVPCERAVLGGRDVAVTRALVEGGRFVRKTITTDGRTYEERVRLFESDELEAMLLAAGIEVTARFGDYEGAPPAADAPRVILIGRAA